MVKLRSFAFLVVVLAALAFIDCVWNGYKIWTTPIRYEVIEGRNNAPDHVGTTNRHYQYMSFRAVSSYGFAPLLIPILISAIALWSAWLMRRLMLLVVTCLFILFVFITGYSIGAAYMLSGLALILAAFVAFAVTTLPI